MKNGEKICLITGASSGIGFAIAKALSQEKYKVIATARRAEKLSQLLPNPIDILPGDLNLPDFQDTLLRFVFEKYKRCDYLLNCAGMLELGNIEEIDIDRMSQMIKLNIDSTFRLTYKILRRFKEQGFGHVINISSVLGTKVQPRMGAYSATKYALEALSEGLRMELAGTNVQISCIEPGLVVTELHKHLEIHPRESMSISEPLSVDNIVGAVRYIIEQPCNVRIPKLMILPKHQKI